MDGALMSKRIAAAVVWSLVGWTFGSMGSFFLGLPAGSDLVLALVLAVVAWEPTGHLWSASSRPRRHAYVPDASSQLATE